MISIGWTPWNNGKPDQKRWGSPNSFCGAKLQAPKVYQTEAKARQYSSTGEVRQVFVGEPLKLSDVGNDDLLREIIRRHKVCSAPTKRVMFRHLEVLIADGKDHSVTLTFEDDGPLTESLKETQ